MKSKDYNNGKIYKIEALGTDDIYIGSTCSPLSVRMALHRAHYKRWKDGKAYKCLSYDLFEKYGLENCKIRLIELYPCTCKDELERREGELQNQLIGKGLVNKNIAGRTKKEYYETNKDKILEYAKEYREDNKDKILEYAKEYYETNKDKIKEYYETNKDKIKEYQKDNKDKIKEYRSQIVTCECGCEIRRDSLERHKKSKKHNELLKIKTI
jgi:hypothetical protein